ncbi:MAG: hypothetical protein ACFFAO_06205, partial [Candidatus Hermodarchaeota archaeon]
MTSLNLLYAILIGFVYSTMLFVSIIVFPSILIWKLGIVIGFTASLITSIIYAFLKEYKNIPIIPLLIYITFFGF